MARLIVYKGYGILSSETFMLTEVLGLCGETEMPITEDESGSGTEYDYPEYQRVVSASGNIGEPRGRNYVDMLFGVGDGVAEILLLSYNNQPIESSHEAPRSVVRSVTKFINDNYSVNSVRFKDS